MLHYSLHQQRKRNTDMAVLGLIAVAYLIAVLFDRDLINDEGA
jgi:hypothetical protein